MINNDGNRNNQKSIMDKVSELIIQVGIVIMLVFFMLALIAPAFVNLLKPIVEKKFANFTYKDELVKEEMSNAKRMAWIICIISWIIFILVNVFVR